MTETLAAESQSQIQGLHQFSLLVACVRCGRPAVTQTANGKYQEEIGGLPQNHGWYCKECFRTGLREEEDAMYS